MFNYYQCDCVAGFNGKSCDNSKRYKCIQSTLFSAKETMKISLQMFILIIEFYVTFGENTENRDNKTFFHHHVRLVTRFVQKLFALVNSILVNSILETEFGVDILILCFERSLYYLV